ncbi:MAG: helix-turn-helix domain-containing protein, partial [Pseudomonadota bacterium]
MPNDEPTADSRKTEIKRFGVVVRARREAKGWSQDALAASALGTVDGKSHVSRIENGRIKALKSDTVRKIAAALGIDRTEVPASLRWPGDAPTWPAILSPGTRVERTVQGREDDVAALHDKLTTAGQVAIVSGGAPANHAGTVVKGMGGIGKSTLARHYIATHATRYRGIWWLRAETEESLIDDLCKLAGHIDVSAADHPEKSERATATVMALNRETEPWLLVYDNATSAAALKPWCPDTGPVALLVTSREGHWPGFAEYRTERLTLGPATDLLLQEARCDGPRDHDRDGARTLAETLDGLPLALVLAGGWLRDVPEAGFADYAARLAELLRTRPKQVGVEDYPVSLYAAVKLSLDQLLEVDESGEPNGPEAALLMQVFAHLDGDDLWPG